MSLRLAHIFRHPIKSHGREELGQVALSEGRCLPWDRHWAVAHEAARLLGDWSECANFLRGAKAPALQAIDAALDEGTATLTLTHPDRPTLRFRPDDPEDAARFLDWVRPLVPEGRAQPARIIATGRGMTDTFFESVSVLSLTANRILSKRMGMDLDLGRWRGNLWLDGLAPWEEFDLIGRTLAIGEARLKVAERITRCRATMANPATGKIDADTLGALEAAYDHTDFGVYAVVTRPGSISAGDTVTVLP